jgi:peptidoglycan hydrolase-like protein with peptidoglycan-binding domain
MSNWQALLKTATKEQELLRARTALGLETVYDLGGGGFDPTQPLTKRCDCSGFVAWAIGIPREFPPRSERWLDTDAYWSGGGAAAKAAGFPLFLHVESADAQSGDLIVYPDRPGGGQGHIGIISEVGADGGFKIIHCSRGNWKSLGDAICETDPHVWEIEPKTRIMRIDFSAMRRYCGITGTTDGPELEAPAETAVPSALHHPLLAAQPTLQLVAAGKLKLTRTGKAVSGIGAVQQAMNILARNAPAYHIDLGPNEANSGIFGPKTEQALKALQSDSNLPKSGVLDADTLLVLDKRLIEHAAEEPAEHEEVPIDSTGSVSTSPLPATSLVFKLEREGGAWFASTLGERFYVGNRVPYQGRVGLMNSKDKTSPVYDPKTYVADYGDWAWFIYPTAVAESKRRFNCLNSYDSAGFTFGFLQFAAHVPDGDFVKYFRGLLELDERVTYFPELELQHGRIVQPTSSGVLQLETAKSTEPLKRYLNPSGGEVEDREVLSAAKFIHWSAHSEKHRNVQVKIGVQTVKGKLFAAQKKVPLEGRSDKVCLVVMDILHQGRGTYQAMRQIVQNNNDAAAYEKLLSIGATRYKERVATIRAEVTKLEAMGHIGIKHYVAAENEFTA